MHNTNRRWSSITLVCTLIPIAVPADQYGRSNAASPDEWASQYPPTDPNADPNAPRGFNVIRNGNQIYGTGANQDSGFVKDQLGNWHGTGALSGKTCIQMPYGGVSCR